MIKLYRILLALIFALFLASACSEDSTSSNGEDGDGDGDGNGGSNLSFESWSGNTPSGWYTSNVSGVYTNVTKTSDAQAGSSAAKGEVVSLQGAPVNAFITSGSLADPYIAITDKITKMKFYYKFSPQGGNDALTAAIYLYQNSALIGSGLANITQATSGYTLHEANITYLTDTTPDKIQIAIASASQTVGTTFQIDNITFE